MVVALPPGGMDADSLGKALERLRGVLRRAALSSNGSSAAARGVAPAQVAADASLAVRWKAAFERYDADKSGGLGINEVRRFVRRDLRLSERALRDPELNAVFQAIDADGIGLITCEEFFNFLRPDRPDRDKRDDSQYLAEAARAVRLIMRRRKKKLGSAEDVLQEYRAYRSVGQETGSTDMTLSHVHRLFRDMWAIERREVTDSSITRMFRALDREDAKRWSIRELQEFVDLVQQEPAWAAGEAPAAARPPSASPAGDLSSAARGPQSAAFHERSTSAGTLPFKQHGRDVPPRDRFALQVVVNGAAPNVAASPSRPVSAQTGPPQLERRAAGGVSGTPPAAAKAASRPRSASGCSRPPGDSYSVIKGAEHLNRVEGRLADAGMMVRQRCLALHPYMLKQPLADVPKELPQHPLPDLNGFKAWSAKIDDWLEKVEASTDGSILSPTAFRKRSVVSTSSLVDDPELRQTQRSSQVGLPESLSQSRSRNSLYSTRKSTSLSKSDVAVLAKTSFHGGA
eukprot:TRINITY_DN9490_c0_g1_i1.p1 TRINITY_DN9490_c0_g1~~TRINITY_DN9490_c0_g1_i1.p1  ORF type:complete len:515 (-),score=116.00 TRINITY_DN9490_c0_g1_i1:475-2019(-)